MPQSLQIAHLASAEIDLAGILCILCGLLQEVTMKKSYGKPTLVRREKLNKVTAGPILILSGETSIE